MPRGIPIHVLSNVDIFSMTADCTKCGEGAPIKFKAHRDGKRPRCREAIKEYRKKERWTAPEGHGLAYDVVKAVKEGAICDICGSDGKLYVDHCHTTGAIRGRLCYRHNMALGYFKDNLEHMQVAMEYLKNPPGIGELNGVPS